MGIEWKTNPPELRSLSKRFGEKTQLLLTCTCTWLLSDRIEEAQKEDQSHETVILGFKRKCNFLRIGGGWVGVGLTAS